MMKTTISLLVLVVMLLGYTSCNQRSSKPTESKTDKILRMDTSHVATLVQNMLPSESLGMNILKKRIDEESQGYISLSSFTKTNGLKKELYGVAYYTMEYTAIVQFERECWKSGNGFVGWFSNFAVFEVEPTGWDAWMAGDTKHFVAGNQVSLNGKLDFEKAENGWRQVQ